MKKPTRTDRKRNAALRHEPKRSTRNTVLILVAVAIFAIGVLWLYNSTRTDSQSLTQSTAQSGNGFQKLKGKWRRTDAEYLLDIKNVDDSGKLDASYLNPKPINISKAQASQQGANVNVTIELRDELYPGSTYNLTYDSNTGTLIGNYYHAGLKQNFEVQFVKAG